MKHIFVPTKSGDDWQQFLAEPERQWRTGFSAKALAYCWEQADGFPPEIASLFSQSGVPSFQQVELLLAFPEYQVSLPGGKRPSQNDLFVLARGADGHLIAITVEGKVSEPFGPTLEEWSVSQSQGKKERLEFIRQSLGVNSEFPPQIRYQLLHRTASAIIEATRFNARSAVMLVHSFSQDDLWFEDFQAFIRLFGVEAQPNRLFWLKERHGISLYTGWAKGDARFLTA